MPKVSTRVVALATVVGSVLAAASTASAALNLPTQSCNYVFTANLKAGMRNAEVRNLQKVLNAYPQTMVAASGAGSAGMETDYFGAATKAAVIKFQSINGVSPTSGNVFSLTRAVLNQVCNGSTPTTPTTPTTSGNVSVMLSANQPTNVLVAGQATARLADFTFSGVGTVTNVKFMRTGVSSNDTLANVYLFDNGMRIAGPASVTTDGSINFGSVSGLFTVNGSKTLTVRSDIKAGVSGQSVGVTLTGYTVAGASMASTMVAGTQLPVANVTLLAADLQGSPAVANPAAASLNAGTMNQTVWSRSLTVSTRAAKLHGLTVKMIGSAPVNSIANVKLVVDGNTVATGMVATDGYVYFDTSAAPVNLTTGAHQIDVRADIVAGANRNFYVVMEQAGDIRLEDSQVAGAFVTPTANSGSTQAINVLGGTVTIQTGSLTITQDTTFSNATNLIGGATNVKLAAYKFTSYGEDVKVLNLTFTPSITGTTPANNNLANVGLYVNGGQVNSNQTATNGSPLTYNNLGTNLLIPAGATVVVELRGDIMSSTSTNYTAGTVKFDLAVTANSVQGISSSNITSNPAQSGQTLTIASTNVSFSSTVGFGASTKAPSQTAKIGSFSFVTGSAEGAKISNIAVTLAGNMVSGNQLTNLKVMDGSTMVGTLIGTPIVGVNNFSANSMVVGANTTKTFEVWGDIQAGANGLVVTPSMQVSYNGAVSNLAASTALVAGVTTTAGVGSIVTGGVTFDPSSSPVAQYIVAGQTNFTIGNFKIKSNNGIASTVTKMTVTVPANTISGVTVNGKYQPLTTATTAVIDFGSSANGIAVPGDASGVNVPVKVNLICSNVSVNSGCTGSSTAVVTAQITSVTYDDGTGAVTTISPTAITPNHILVASKPVVAVAQLSTNGLFNGNVKLGEVTISADAAADISLAQLPITVASTTGISLSGVMLKDSSGSTVIVGTSGTNGSTVLTGTGNFVFSTPRVITKGTSETYAIYGTVAGVAGNAGTASVTFGAGAAANFLWNDVQGGSFSNTGASIFAYPTNTQTKTN